MAKIVFSKQEKEVLIHKLQRYFSAELDRDLGQFEADFLLDFIAGDIGAFFYNRGLQDAQALIVEKMESVADAIYEIEQPTDLSR